MATFMPAKKLLVTVAEFTDFIAQPENRQRLFELIHGEIVEKMPAEEHGYVAGQIVRHIGNHVEAHNLEGYPGVEVCYYQPDDPYNKRLPDVSYRAGTTAIVTDGAVPQMPDLAVEIQSPDDTPREMRAAALYYLQNGSKLVWLVYPQNRLIEVCSLRGILLEVQTLTEDDTLAGGDVLPGLSVSVTKLLPKKK